MSDDLAEAVAASFRDLLARVMQEPTLQISNLDEVERIQE